MIQFLTKFSVLTQIVLMLERNSSDLLNVFQLDKFGKQSLTVWYLQYIFG